ncbi:MAG: M48 family metallopeptidase [Alphaproteobacteria bacterium]|nr:M48 family metallopeptidase [Alphaproteobacteria bacterium]
MKAAGLNTHIWNNNLRSLLLIGFYPLMLAGLVWAVAALTGALLMPHAVGSDSAMIWARSASFAHTMVAAYWPLILTVVAGWFVIAYFFQGKMIRALSHAHPVTRKDEPALYNMLENLCIAQGMKTPRLEIIETDALNAFASGIDDRTYAVTVTRGLLKTLAPDELGGVLAHELTHIINRDVRLLIVSIIFVGMVGFFAQMVWSFIRFNAYSRSRNNRDGRIVILLMAIGAVLWIGYIATLLTRFALSRRREYMADAGAVAMTKNPDAMMRALLRISGKDRIPGAPDDIALMCIENTHRFMGLFTTHPPIEDRIRALSETTGTPLPDVLPPAAAANPRNPWRRRD